MDILEIIKLIVNIFSLLRTIPFSKIQEKLSLFRDSSYRRWESFLRTLRELRGISMEKIMSINMAEYQRPNVHRLDVQVGTPFGVCHVVALVSLNGKDFHGMAVEGRYMPEVEGVRNAALGYFQQ